MPGLLLSGLARSAVFAPIEPGGRVEAVVQRLSDSIALGMLHDGEQLPAQQELAAGLGVSLVTLRDALALLRQQGLIETRRGHGGGSFVRVNSRVSTAQARQRLRLMSSHDLGDLADMQRAVSGQAARLAAERSTQDFAARLAGHVETLRRASKLADRARVDGRFRIEVAAASQSVRLTRMEMHLQAEATGLRWLPLLDAGGAEDQTSVSAYHDAVVDSHAALVAALRKGAGGKAQAVAETRVDQDLQRLLVLHMQALSR